MTQTIVTRVRKRISLFISQPVPAERASPFGSPGSQEIWAATLLQNFVVPPLSALFARVRDAQPSLLFWLSPARFEEPLAVAPALYHIRRLQRPGKSVGEVVRSPV
jgi:hypothetical protein